MIIMAALTGGGLCLFAYARTWESIDGDVMMMMIMRW